MLARLVRLTPLALALAASACSSPLASGTRAPVDGPVPRPSAVGGLAGLVNGSSVISQEEAELRDLQRRPTAIRFPAAVGVLFYEYTDPLRQEDHQSVVEGLGTQMIASGLVRTVAPIPSNVVRQGDSLDALRNLAARFQVDVLLLVSGAQTLEPADEQPATGFLDFGATKTAYEARSTLTGLAIGVYSGTFLTPFEVVGKAGPETIDPAAPNAGTALYRVRKAAEEVALGRIKDDFLASLGRAKAAQDAATPAPSTSPEATASPASTASPEGSATPAPSATPST